MSADRLDRLELLFRAAQLHAPEDRAAFLEAACADDPALRRDLDDLLRADDQAEAEAFLEGFAPGWEAPRFEESGAGRDDGMKGRPIGPYVVLRRLGHGGMGDVYLAVREQPFKQYVALKIIRRGMDTREVVARFAVERQILAALNHPHIARLLDGGVTDEGLPYFAMDYVDGRPITAYCDEHRLSLRERLRLFQTVCQAVHYAHQNLIIHRDLKPSNILVTEDGVVKLLDFGIAKLLNPHLSPVAMPVTRTELRLMTPEYASPEQIGGESLTTATDVYALGVILYELLTGHRPYRVAGRPTQEIIALIYGQEPERPSTRITKTETLTRPDGTETVITPDAVSATRGMPVERLQRQIRGDLDNITLTALRKEPERRYGSAEQLGQDVERYLSGLPVEARPSTLGYRLRKFAARHRAAVVAAVLVVLSLVGGLSAALWQAREASQERDRAQSEAAKAEEVTGFLLSLFERADPTSTPGDTVSVREVLDRGASHIATNLAGQPILQAELLEVVAGAFDNLGRSDRAADLLERSLALRRAHGAALDAGTARGIYAFAEVKARQGYFEEAEALFREYVALMQRLHGEAHIEVLRGTYRLWGVLHQQGEASAADSLFGILLAMEQALPPEDDPARSFVITEMAYALSAMRRYGEAEAYYRTALDMERRLNGDQHPRVAYLKSRLAGILNLQERPEEAEAYAREAVLLSGLLYPEGHERAASALYHLGRTYEELGRYDEAVGSLQEAVAMLRRLHGIRHRSLPLYTHALARVYDAREAFADAEPHYRALVDISSAQHGADAAATLSARADVGDNLRRQGRHAEAESLLLDAYQRLRERLGEEHRRTRRAAEQLAALYEARGKPGQATR